MAHANRKLAVRLSAKSLRAATLLTSLAIGCLGPGLARADTSSPGATGESGVAPPVEQTLSNDSTLTTWAHPFMAAPIHAAPETHSRRLSTMRLYTEDGFPEVYLLLRSTTDSEGRTWVELRIPGRPNGREGWVLREWLGSFHQTKWMIRISLHQRRLRAYYAGRLRLSAPVGVGKPSSPTPAGHFWIRERFRLSDRSNPYWPYALGTSDYSTLTDWPGGGVVGIHGDFGQPQLIPGDPSHGCVRMRDTDLAWLAPRVTLGTPVDIS